jgi:hypothetical protein
LPDAEALFPEVAELVRLVGRDEDVAAVRAAILRRELYLCRSVSRVLGEAMGPSKRSELEVWMACLGRELGEGGVRC